MSFVFRKKLTRYLDARGKRVARDTPGARKVQEKSAKWYGRWVDPDGTAHTEPLCRDKQAAQALLTEKVKQGERRAAGLAVPHEEHLQRPLAAHLRDWEAAMLGDGATPSTSPRPWPAPDG